MTNPPAKFGTATTTGGGFSSQLVCFAILAIQGMWRNRIQMVLTAVTMGVGSMTLALTIFVGQGAQQGVWQDMEQMVGSWVVAYPHPDPTSRLAQFRPSPDFTSDDLAQVRQRLAGARMVVPAWFAEFPVLYANRMVILPIDCIPPSLQKEAPYRPQKGRELSPLANQGKAWECLVTQSLANQFGLNLDGREEILINDNYFRVVGIITDPISQAAHMQHRLVVPYSLAKMLWLPPDSVGNIVAAWHGPQDMSQTLQGMEQALTEARVPKSFFLSSTHFMLEKGKKIIDNFIGLGAVQALFCILIASIGVLNVMLTNVARRSHEFALRIAMGASMREILFLVLCESVVLGMIGAALGVLAAVFLAPYVSEVFSAQIPEAAGLQPMLSSKGIIVPLAVSGLCGLVAGIIPAFNVRRMDMLALLRKDG